MISDYLFAIGSNRKGGSAEFFQQSASSGGVSFRDFFTACFAAEDDRRSISGLSPDEALCMERASAMVKNRSLDKRQIRRASSDELAEVSAWLLAGASGLAATPTLTKAADSVGAGEAVISEAIAEEASGAAEIAPAGSLSAEDAAAGEEFLLAPRAENLLFDILTGSAKAAETPAPADWSPLAAMVGMAQLQRDELWALARSLFVLLAASGGSEEPSSALACDIIPGAQPSDMLARIGDALAKMTGEEIKSVLMQAAGRAKCGTLNFAQHDLPVVALRSLAMEVLEAVFAPDCQPAEIMLQALARSGQGIKAISLAEGASDSPSSSSPSALPSSILPAEEASDAISAAIKTAGGPISVANEADKQPVAALAHDNLHPAGADLQGKEYMDSAVDNTRSEPLVAIEENPAKPAPASEIIPPGDATLVRKRESVAGEGGEAADRFEMPPAVNNRLEPVTAGASQRSPQSAVAEPQVAENLERVVQAMRLAIRRGISQVSVELSPPELGRLNLRLEMRHGAVSAVIQAEKAEARHLLLSGLEQLRQNLHVQGLELDFFDVHLGNHDNGAGSGDWPAPFSRPMFQQDAVAEESQIAPADIPAPLFAPGAPNLLNVIV